MSSVCPDLTALCRLISVTAQRTPFFIAIDGPCGSGKTTLAHALSKRLGAAVLSLDDYFLQPCQRTPERLSTPGENIDHERFLCEVLQPLRSGKTCMVRPFDCSLGQITEGYPISPTPFVLVEGSYSLHPQLRPLYDFSIFLHLPEALQLQRLASRETKESFERYKERWIPMENAYFKALMPDRFANAELQMDTFDLQEFAPSL